ncbi:MAG: hypothetical protein K8S54_00445 [Spirochaetia bacterium]|nr:hypothetical protein [Spirochaetia bacterium]
MKLKSATFISLLVLFATPSFANLRAPWHIAPFPSFALVGNGALIVLSEDLEFDCPALYEDDEAGLDALQKSACKVTATYTIASSGDTRVNLEFIGPSTDAMTVNVNGAAASIATSMIPITRKQAESYGMYPMCRFCASDEMPLKSGRFSAHIVKGSNTIVVRYVQQLASNEISYGYFQDSKWSQGFEYELWPLAEWVLAADFKMNLKIKVPARSFFQRIFGTEHPWQCRAVNFGKAGDRSTRLPFPNRNRNPIAPDMLSSEPIALNNKTGNILETTFSNKFPDRLSCWMQ